MKYGSGYKYADVNTSSVRTSANNAETSTSSAKTTAGSAESSANSVRATASSVEASASSVRATVTNTKTTTDSTPELHTTKMPKPANPQKKTGGANLRFFIPLPENTSQTPPPCPARRSPL